MHDLVVRNGTVVDGTGAARRQVDVAIDNGLITALEFKAGRARREVNAEGLLVTPGWVTSTRARVSQCPFCGSRSG
jgi:N-acyl-D-aspartate/D-glutamate deacylase